MTSPWISVEPLDDHDFAELRRRAIFECCKWDPQVGDACVLSRTPLVIRRDGWDEVVRLAETLAAEAAAAERELANRPDLHRVLGLPRAVRGALRPVRERGVAAAAGRLTRFDFHFTTEGWRISEANTDVPGGLNEASGLPLLVAAHFPWARSVGDPTGAYADSLFERAGRGATIAFVHATAYSDDQQMMTFLAGHLQARGVKTHLASPSHLRWRDGRAELSASWWKGPLDLIVRFFPTEWLPALPRETGWPMLFAGTRTPISNPATAILTQSKRFPPVWDSLETKLTTWRACLPETRDPRDAKWRAMDDWVVKPALGRVGEGVGMRGAVSGPEMARIARSARWFPSAWVAQRQFETIPIDLDGTKAFPCLGVYTLDCRVIGAYGRLASTPLIDARAADAAVLAA